MEAWMFNQVGAPLELQEIPDPSPGPDEAVVHVMAAGLCHTDVSFMDGALQDVLGFTPIILGHEAAVTDEHPHGALPQRHQQQQIAGKMRGWAMAMRSASRPRLARCYGVSP